MFRKCNSFLWLAGIFAFASVCTAEEVDPVSETWDELDNVIVTVSPNNVLRTLDSRFSGFNMSTANYGHYLWNESSNGDWRNAIAEDNVKDLNPGFIRWPGGNACYRFHFELARTRTAHKINHSSTPRSDFFRPQDLLQVLHETGATPIVHTSAAYSSPQEAAALVAYFVAPKDRNCRDIGNDSWRAYNWGNTCTWAAKREDEDGQQRYEGTIYLAVGNEEWYEYCNSGCLEYTDYYGRRASVRRMTIEDEGFVDENTGAVIRAYWPNYRDTYKVVRSIFSESEVQVGAIVQNLYRTTGGADDHFNTGDNWNDTLFDNINADPNVSIDFVAMQIYKYEFGNWHLDYSSSGDINSVYAYDEMKARAKTILDKASPLRPDMIVTEFDFDAVNQLNSNGGPAARIDSSSLHQALSVVSLVGDTMQNTTDIIGSTYWQLSNTIQPRGLLKTTSSGSMYRTGQYHAQKLLGLLQKTIVDSSVSGADSYTPNPSYTKSWWSPSALPTVSSVATKSDDGKTLLVLVINKKTNKDYNLIVNPGFNTQNTYAKWTLNSDQDDHDGLFRVNDENNEFVTSHKTTHFMSDGRAFITLKKHSAIVLQFDKAPPVELFSETFDVKGEGTRKNPWARWTEPGPQRRWNTNSAHVTTNYSSAGGTDSTYVARARMSNGESVLEMKASEAVNTSGASTITIEFARFLDESLENKDYLRLQGLNVSGWSNLVTLYGTDNSNQWNTTSVKTTSSIYKHPNFRIRFIVNNHDKSSSEWVYIDDIKISMEQ